VLGLDSLSRVPRIVESGRTFDVNAAIKARRVRDALRREPKPARVDFVLADDSGLRVEALRGAPGIRSARYAGTGADDRANRRKILRAMERKSNRRAVFHCSMVLIVCRAERPRVRRVERPRGRRREKIHLFRGCVAGRITRVERGSGGFGYDPIFIPVGRPVTFAELSGATKNRISHRARTLQRVKRWLARRTPD
jgi:XTP/dITP diphosphohydrolase